MLPVECVQMILRGRKPRRAVATSRCSESRFQASSFLTPICLGIFPLQRSRISCAHAPRTVCVRNANNMRRLQAAPTCCRNLKAAQSRGFKTSCSRSVTVRVRTAGIFIAPFAVGVCAKIICAASRAVLLYLKLCRVAIPSVWFCDPSSSAHLHKATGISDRRFPG
jgi:hypothetical protein